MKKVEIDEYFNSLDKFAKKKFCYKCFYINMQKSIRILSKDDLTFDIDGIKLTKFDVKKYSLYYVNNYASKVEVNTYDNYCKLNSMIAKYHYSFKLFIKNRGICDTDDVSKAQIYYEKYANDKEKTRYDNIIEIINKRDNYSNSEKIYSYCKSVDFNVKKMLEYACKLNIKMYDLIDIVNSHILNKFNCVSNLDELSNTDDEIFNDVESLFMIYLNGNYDNLTDFMEKIEKDKKFIVRCLEMIKERKFDLYNKIIEKENIDVYKQKIINKIYFVLELIKNGVKLEYGLRKFTYFDYYQLVPLKKDELFTLISDSFGSEDLSILGRFFSNYDEDSLINNDLLSKLEVVIIDGMSYQLSNDDKINIINYINDNHLPCLNVIYEGARDLYVREIVYGTKKENIKMKKLAF